MDTFPTPVLRGLLLSSVSGSSSVGEECSSETTSTSPCDESLLRLLHRLHFSGVSLGVLVSATTPGDTLEQVSSVLPPLHPSKNWAPAFLSSIIPVHSNSPPWASPPNSGKGGAEDQSTWPLGPESSILVTRDEAEARAAHCQGWPVLLWQREPSPGSSAGGPGGLGSLPTLEWREGRLRGVSVVHHLAEVLPTLCPLHRQAYPGEVCVVGYAMKWSRELDFLKRKMFPLFPSPIPVLETKMTPPGSAQCIAFLPVDLDLLQHQPPSGTRVDPGPSALQPLPSSEAKAGAEAGRSSRAASLSLAQASVMLHKATDELTGWRIRPVPVSPSCPIRGETEGTVPRVETELSSRFSLMQSLCEERSPPLTLMDPVDSVLPLADRLRTLSLLASLLPHPFPSVQAEGTKAPIVRSPAFAVVRSNQEAAALLSTPGEDAAPAGAGRCFEGGQASAMGGCGIDWDGPCYPSLRPLKLPVIVKPLIACGLPESHAMAIVFSSEALASLTVPMPAIIQEYVDHGAVQYKCYVLGHEFFWAQRKSTPDAQPGVGKPGAVPGGSAAIQFDSLRSLPLSFGEKGVNGGANQMQLDKDKATAEQFHEGAARRVAQLLKSQHQLSLIGFDVLVQQGTGEHVIVDVNYFPSFKDVASDLALPAFWRACSSLIVHSK